MRTMPTIKEASTRQVWNFHAKVVNKGAFVYVKQDKDGKSFARIYYIHLIDSEGTTIELKTCRPIKIYTVDRKVALDKVYQVWGEGDFGIPNKQYSTASFEIWNDWFIGPLENDTKFKMKSFLPCSNNIDQAKKNLDKKAKPENIVAKCVGRPIKGPDKYIFGRPLVKGWYIKLCDANGKEFYALVWHQQAILRKTEFQLFNSHKNQLILLVGVRGSYTDSSKYTGETNYTVITNCPPVLEPQSVPKSKLAELSKFKPEIDRSTAI